MFKKLNIMSQKCPECHKGNESHKEFFKGLAITYYLCGHGKTVVVVNESMQITENARAEAQQTFLRGSNGLTENCSVFYQIVDPLACEPPRRGALSSLLSWASHSFG